MNKEELILKWLNGETLSSEELEAFKKLDNYDALIKVSTNAKAFRAPSFNEEKNLEQILANRAGTNKKSKNNLTSWILRVAAVLVIGFTLYFVTDITFSNQNFQTEVAQVQNIDLPDESEVYLNAVSSISFDKRNWKQKRKVKLEGEAFFKVTKGQKFDVITDAGTVSVLGTQFDVTNRNKFFQVNCYEGRVGVTIANKYYELTAGKALQFYNNNVKQLTITDQDPSWLHNRSAFKSVPFSVVLEEFEIQYGKKIVLTESINSNVLFTGNFVHTDMISALQSITLPLQLSYKVTNNTISLHKE